MDVTGEDISDACVQKKNKRKHTLFPDREIFEENYLFSLSLSFSRNNRIKTRDFRKIVGGKIIVLHKTM